MVPKWISNHLIEPYENVSLTNRVYLMKEWKRLKDYVWWHLDYPNVKIVSYLSLKLLYGGPMRAAIIQNVQNWVNVIGICKDLLVGIHNYCIQHGFLWESIQATKKDSEQNTIIKVVRIYYEETILNTHNTTTTIMINVLNMLHKRHWARFYH